MKNLIDYLYQVTNNDEKDHHVIVLHFEIQDYLKSNGYWFDESNEQMIIKTPIREGETDEDSIRFYNDLNSLRLRKRDRIRPVFITMKHYDSLLNSLLEKDNKSLLD